MCTGYVCGATSGRVGPAREGAATGVRTITGAAPDKGDDEVAATRDVRRRCVHITVDSIARRSKLQPAVRGVASVGLDFDLGDQWRWFVLLLIS